MRTRYDNLDLSFSLDGYTFRALNIVCEQFLRPIPRHAHSEGSYELHYIPRGLGEVFLDGARYPLRPGSLYVTGPHVEHEQFTDAADPMTEYCIYFHIQKKESARLLRSLTERFLQTKLWIGEDTQGLLPLFLALFQELSQRKAGFSIEVKSLLQQIIVRMVRNYEADSAAAPLPLSHDLHERRSIILEECFLYEYDSLTLPALAARLGLSCRQTQRLLAEQYSQTFQQRRTQARMSAAIAFLRSSDESVTAIAEHLGFSSVEHFCSAFRTYYGESPRACRNRMARERDS
ncbi:MAG: AraC family transcriptional regulator [Eubacteriales bacterium]|nr:AraC family transcriptional regulator [Eubacteriales bacterium]